MAAEGAAAAADYSRFGRYDQRTTNSAANSSDSEPETPSSPKNSGGTAHPMATPKRNKRKNFKPRCSTTNVEVPSEMEGVAEFSNNNNLKNVRRRKTTSTRKLVVDSR